MRHSTLAFAVVALITSSALGCETKFTMKPATPPLGGAGNAAIGVQNAGSMAVANAGTGMLTGNVMGTAGSVDNGGAGSGDVTMMGAGTGSAPMNTAGAGEAGAGDPLAGSGSAGSDSEPVDMPQTCPATSTLTPGESTPTVQVGGTTRSYILHVPASYTGQSPVPLILDFHGILMNSGLQRSFSGFAELSESEGFIVAFPEGTDTAFNVGICCTSSTAVDDVAFARAIVAQLSQQGCIDQKRLHATGYSMGGGMAMKLACEAADLFASIAESAFDLMPESDWPCQPSRPIPIIAFRSTGDPIVFYGGAVDTIPPNGNPNLVSFIGAEANFEKWSMLNGCTDAPQDVGGGCKHRTQCAGGAEVQLCTKQGGGHDYMDAARGWAFLEQHPMP